MQAVVFPGIPGGVTEVDMARKRIGLTMRKDGGSSARADRKPRDADPRLQGPAAARRPRWPGFA